MHDALVHAARGRQTSVAAQLLQRFAVLGEVETFDLVLLAHPQRIEERDHLEQDEGQHPGPDRIATTP